MNPPFRRRGKFVLTTGFQMAFDTYCSSYTGPRKVATQKWSPSLVHLAKPPDGKGKEGLGIIYSSMARCAKWGTYLKWSFLLMMIPRKGGMIFYQPMDHIGPIWKSPRGPDLTHTQGLARHHVIAPIYFPSPEQPERLIFPPLVFLLPLFYYPFWGLNIPSGWL